MFTLTTSNPDGGINSIVSHSQAGQDAFAFENCGRKLNGTFVDIGCNDPYIHNNTVALEHFGWRGVCVDIAPFDYSVRKSKFILADVRKRVRAVETFLDKHEGRADYLSLDADDATYDSMTWLIPFYKFGCITVEHDSYRVGPEMQEKIRDYLVTFGYTLKYKDVRAPEAPGMPWSNQPFEDWYVYRL